MTGPVIARGEVGQAVCKALGLDAKGVRSIVLTFNVDQIVTATVVVTPDREQVIQLLAEMEQRGVSVAECDVTSLADTSRIFKLVHRTPCINPDHLPNG